MRSRRLIKKLSKNLAEHYKNAWIPSYDDDLYFKGKYIKGGAKGIFHVGGEADYWGEGTDFYTALEVAMDNFYGWASFCGCEICQDSFDPACTEVCQVSRARLKIRPTFKAIKKVLESGA